MFLVQVNDDEGILTELVHVGTNLAAADASFISTCAKRITNWREYTCDDIQSMQENGYEKFDGGVIMLIDTSNCVTDSELQDQMAEEVWYVWKEWITVEGEDKPRLLTPWSDPQLYEYPFDFMYATREKAIAGRKEMEATEGEDWVLCKETLTEISQNEG